MGKPGGAGYCAGWVGGGAGRDGDGRGWISARIKAQSPDRPARGGIPCPFCLQTEGL